jgi:hypothetical protein
LGKAEERKGVRAKALFVGYADYAEPRRLQRVPATSWARFADYSVDIRGSSRRPMNSLATAARDVTDVEAGISAPWRTERL